MFLPTNKAAWGFATLILFSFLWLPPSGLLDFSKEFFNPSTGGSFVEGVRVVGPISLVILVFTGAVGWCVQGVGVLLFRDWIYPELERRYGVGVTLRHIVSPRRLWKLHWLRRVAFVSATCLIVLLGACAFFRVRRPADLLAYQGMAAECHPVWRAFALRKFSQGDPADALVAKYPPIRTEEFGRYAIYRYNEGMSFTGFGVIAKDGNLMTAGGGSCTWTFTFFETVDPQLDREHAAYMQERREKLRRLRGRSTNP